MFPFFGGLNGDDFFPTEEDEEAAAEDRGMNAQFEQEDDDAEDSAGEDEGSFWDDYWDQI